MRREEFTVETAAKTKHKISPHKVLFTVLLYLLGITMLTPLLWMISTSFKIENEVFEFPIRWIPKTFVGLENYKVVWGEEYNFGLYYLNSIKITILSVVLQVLVSALGAYGFTKVNWKWRDKVFLLYLATNGTASVQAGRIKSAGIAPYFRDIFISEKLGANKPSRAFFQACFDAIPDFDPAAAIVVGDSLTSDIRGAINAGLRSCWYDPKGLPPRPDIVPDHTIRDLAELPPLLARL